MAEYKLLTKDFGTEGLQTLAVYERLGGYQGLREALARFTPDELVEEVRRSGIRGRGGAGFPTGQKWSFLPKNVFPRYLCVNADESEPGCFKDRYLIDENPHQLIEGTLIAAYALQVQTAFLYIRGEYHDQRLLLERCVEEARQAGYIGQGVLGSCHESLHAVSGGVWGREVHELKRAGGHSAHPDREQQAPVRGRSRSQDASGASRRRSQR